MKFNCYTISELLYYSSNSYLQYFSKKTGYLVNNSAVDLSEQVKWIWKHLNRIYNFQDQVKLLSENEKEALWHLINNFGHLKYSEAYGENLEIKIPWIFKHPQGGVFIPLEMLKLLMEEKEIRERHFLFNVIFRLGLKEMKNFASFTANTLEGQVTISFENNARDMSLVLYLWLINKFFDNLDKTSSYFNKEIIITPLQNFVREDQHKKDEKIIANNWPIEPVPIWEYLTAFFPEKKREIDKWHHYLINGNKGFYRSLALLASKNSKIVEIFRNGLLVPVINKRHGKYAKNREIKIVTPSEFHYWIALRSAEKITSIKNQL